MKKKSDKKGDSGQAGLNGPAGLNKHQVMAQPGGGTGKKGKAKKPKAKSGY